MLSGLLRSEIAVQANINIMRAFFQMQEALLIVSNTQLQLEQIRAEIKQLRTDMNDTLADQNDINGMALCLAMLATTEGLSSQRSEGSLRPYLHTCPT
jgi:hypothetical protein